MRLKKVFPLLLTILTALSSNAIANQLIFKCDIKNNKQVSIYKHTDDVTYYFGKINSVPDIKLKRKKKDLYINLVNLSGRYLTNSIEIKNGDYSYRFTTSVDRIADEQIPKTSLTVMKNGKDLTSFQCIEGSEVGALISIDD